MKKITSGAITQTKLFFASAKPRFIAFAYPKFVSGTITLLLVNNFSIFSTFGAKVKLRRKLGFSSTLPSNDEFIKLFLMNPLLIFIFFSFLFLNLKLNQ